MFKTRAIFKPGNFEKILLKIWTVKRPIFLSFLNFKPLQTGLDSVIQSVWDGINCVVY